MVPIAFPGQNSHGFLIDLLDMGRARQAHNFEMRIYNEFSIDFRIDFPSKIDAPKRSANLFFVIF